MHATKIIPIGADFNDTTFTFTIEGKSTWFLMRLENIAIDDDIDEIEQSFALVAACFQRQVGDTNCYGRTGATEIRIMDNDSK